MLSDEYQARAVRHRPVDRASLVSEIHRLSAGGLTARDIGAAIGMQPEEVVNVIHPGAGAVIPTEGK